MKTNALCFGLLLLAATPLLADPYRLIAGDHVVLHYNLIAAEKTAMVDLDGNIRLAELGSVIASGKSLDDLQVAIAQAMLANGFAGTPSVTVEIVEYAPIIVSGYVARSGVFAYTPGMTAGAALAMTGNTAIPARSFATTEIAALTVQRRIDSLGAQLASAAAQIARLQAGLAGPDAPIIVADDLKNAVPEPELARLELLLAAEDRLLVTQRTAARDLVRSWDREIADNLTQIELLDARIVIKAETVAQLTRDVDAARNLQSRGLTTNAQTTATFQRLADEREELLALETTKLTVQRGRALAERSRQQYAAETTTGRLQDLTQAQARLNLLQGDRGLALQEMTLMLAETGTTLSIADAPTLRMTLQGPRADRMGDAGVTAATVLLPGDVLVVDVVP